MTKPQCQPNSDTNPSAAQTEVPPGIDSSTPVCGQNQDTTGAERPGDIERDIHLLAARVGGLYRLREVIDGMCGAEG